MRVSFLTASIAIALVATSLDATAADADGTATPATTARHRHHKAAQNAAPAPAGPNMQAELAMRDQEIADLKNALASVEAKVGELEQRTNAQSDINVATQQNVEKLQADAPRVDKLARLVNDTTVGGRVFIDISDFDREKNGVKSSTNGDGLDVKRGYLTVNHSFNDTWSASLITDFNYATADSETQLFIKNLYLQGKFDDAFVFRAGALPMAWTPYVENFYGYRYVENTLIDKGVQATKQSFGNTADWGLSAGGKLADGMLDYQANVVNGGGYKNPTRSKGMDFEGRVAFSPIDHTAIAIGGYSGDLGQDTETTPAKHTASRVDAMVAYADGNNRLGAEYFQANNWTAVTTIAKDKADGYSLWGSYGFTNAFSLFGRYDSIKPNKDTDASLRDKYYNLGVQWDVRKGIKVAAVYKNDDLKDDANETRTKEFGIFGDISF
ncbi:MAG TPA: carbohydrate porin [Xanthomonadaceae bacterium]|jgi:hypothetical protein